MDNDMNVTALILAGGLGKRIRSVESEKPKVMIEINNKPFVHYIIDELIIGGIASIIILCGHKYEYIINYFSKVDIPDTNIIFSIEGKLMGTAGALLNVKKIVKYSSILLLNGDTYTRLDYERFYKNYGKSDAKAGICIKNIESDGNVDPNYAGIDIDSNNRIISYNEKSNGKYASCGIYLFDYEVFKYLTNAPSSIEFDLIPRLLKNEVPIYGYEIEDLYYDIGTPEGLKNFESYIK